MEGRSVTKSFKSTVVGFAVEEGLIESIDDPVSQYLPEYSSLFDGSKEKVLIRHLLTMSAGFMKEGLACRYGCRD